MESFSARTPDAFPGMTPSWRPADADGLYFELFATMKPASKVGDEVTAPPRKSVTERGQSRWFGP